MTREEYMARLERERPGCVEDILMRAEHQRRVDVFYRRARQITPLEWDELIAEVDAYEPKPSYKPRSKKITKERQLQIAVEAAEKRIA